MSTKKLLFIILFIVSSFFRLYRINELTLFLGDQGRTGIIVYNSFINRTIPLEGPTVLSGDHLGPIFYYIVAPIFVLCKFHPIGVAVFMSLLDVFTTLTLFYIGTQLFALSVGFLVAMTYAVSPYLATASRQIWEPTIIPFFVILLLFSFLKIYKEKKFSYSILAFVCFGVLLQLHYPNVLLCVPSILLSIWLVLHLNNAQRIQYAIWTLLGVLVFFCVLFPFLLYEWLHQFTDVRDLIYVLIFSHASQGQFLPFANVIDFTFRLFKYVFPINSVYIIIPLAICIIIIPLIIRKNFWHGFFVFWFLTGVVGMSFYRGIVFNHYLNFLVPVPFLLLGSFISTVQNTQLKKLFQIFLIMIILLNILSTDVFSKGSNDISRVDHITSKIIQLSKNQKFAFTLMNTISDLHYRYFFLLKHQTFQPITSTHYTLLFVVCDTISCPSFNEMKKNTSVTGACYTMHCNGSYPVIDLHTWRLVSLDIIDKASLFVYKSR